MTGFTRKSKNTDRKCMKIIYVTDVHGDFEKVKNLLSETVADVYIIAGDLIDMPFYNMETSIRYHELQSYFHGLRMSMNKEDMLLEDFVDELLEKPDVQEKIQNRGTRYQQYTIRARRVMQQKYKVLKNIISMKRLSKVYCLPGNYDMDLKYTSLHENDLHLHWYQIEDLRICGYGGADVWTPGIPQRYIVKYDGGIKRPEANNEMYRFFRAVKPQIIVAHQPAYGIHDRSTSGGPFGSPALRRYCETHPVLLCLTGHAHDSWGVRLMDETLFMNPSNFGTITTTTGEVSEGGFFYQIELEQGSAKTILFKKICDDRIYDIADYHPGNGKWIEEIVDQERYNALKVRQGFDVTEEKYSHIPQIQLFRDIKKFYRMFQTQETEDRMDKLEEVVRFLEDKIEGDIAMDVMGSVNVGLSQVGSDIDFVLYLRCNSDCNTGFGKCDLFKKAETTIKDILGNEYDFQIMDCIDLNQVEKSIIEKNYECETLQLFVAYRAICRPINYRVIAPIEDLLNQDMAFRKEVEGSIQTYIRIFTNTSQHLRSLKKYEARLNAIGIKLPDSIKRTIKQYLGES
jgi:Icc-related predicted phosphoesterase